ncbi:DNA translocase FtsK [Helicobacter sp. faydin-H23]|nr:DNA translocase FtsK [Helicobacter kayseriensis]
MLLIFGAFGLMGKFGSSFFGFNFYLFGILCYLWPILLFYIIRSYQKHKKNFWHFLEISLGTIALFLFLLVIQALSFKTGIFGRAITTSLVPHIGYFGIWIVSIFGLCVCLLSLSQKDPIQLIKQANLPHILTKTKHFFSQCLLGGIKKSLPIFKKISISCKHIFHSAKLHFSHHSPALPFAKKDSQDSLVDLKNLLPHPQETHQSANPNPTQPAQPKQERIMFKKDEKLNIQEFVIATKTEEKKVNIRVVDKIQPQKENPFLKDHFPLGATQAISTSAELLKKIKTQDSQPQNPTQEPQISPSQSATSSQPYHPSPSLDQHISDHPYSPEETLELPTEDASLKTSPQTDLPSPEENPKHTSLATQYPSQDQPSPSQDSISSTPSPTPPSLAPSPIAPNAFSKPRVAHIKTLEENEALLKEIDQGNVAIPKDYKLPPISLLSPAPQQENEIDENEIDSKIQSLLEKLSVFKIEGDVIRTYSGPIITTLEFRPAPNVKVSRIQSLENDIAMALEAKSIRIQAPIPGKNVVGIEIPNSNTQTIYLREIFESEIFQNSASPLTLALGKDVVGNPFITDLKKLPHLLIAGTTGSGKSVGVNAMILSLLYRNSPDDLKLMMVDPKMVEFMPYSDLPHLITPIITDPKKAVIGLANAVREMERRYTLMSQSRTKEIISYNQKAQEMGLEKFPYFVIIIDELADLMMTAGKEVEYSMARIAQMGRASGMHLIVATQSPRAEVLTGLIKTNLPAHLSYKVGTKIDAGIIGCAGAETLLGRGDMLFTPPGVSGLVRLHAPWSSEDEVNAIVSYIKDQRETLYDPSFLPEEKEVFGALDCNDLDDETAQLLERAKQIIIQDGKTSISYLQRRLSIGYNKAATLIEKLEQIGFLSEADSKGNRQIL